MKVVGANEVTVFQVKCVKNRASHTFKLEGIESGRERGKQYRKS